MSSKIFSSSLWHNTSLKQQSSQIEDDYEILLLEIYNYKLIVVLCLAQHISETTVEPKRGRLQDFAVINLQLQTYCRPLFGTTHL